MNLDELQRLCDEASPGPWQARTTMPKLIAVARAAKDLRDNYGGEARDVDLDALDVALAALKQTAKVADSES